MQLIFSIYYSPLSIFNFTAYLVQYKYNNMNLKMQVTICYFCGLAGRNWFICLLAPFFDLNLQVIRKYKQVLDKFVPKNKYNYSKITITI